ncbi:MAG: hypothetical protein H0X16_04500 [Chloroflexi bacterium]|nr:hypothetical protein [Chloroflexota bacterium]
MTSRDGSGAWRAGVSLDDALVRRLTGSQVPELGVWSLRLLAEGWDNAVWSARRS